MLQSHVKWFRWKEKPTSVGTRDKAKRSVKASRPGTPNPGSSTSWGCCTMWQQSGLFPLLCGSVSQHSGWVGGCPWAPLAPQEWHWLPGGCGAAGQPSCPTWEQGSSPQQPGGRQTHSYLQSGAGSGGCRAEAGRQSLGAPAQRQSTQHSRWRCLHWTSGTKAPPK